jgi:hypothetical protein
MGRKATHGVSAKDFHDSLIKTLGNLSGLRAHEPIPFKDCYAPILEETGIDPDEYGVQESTGKMWVHQWINFAMRDHRNAGFTTSPKRGRWALTDSGVSEAKRLLGIVEDTVEEVVEIQETTQPMVSTPKASGIIRTMNTVSNSTPLLQVAERTVVTREAGSQIDGTAYHHDAYIRGLGVAQTRCFGYFSERSRVCGRCPIQGPCKDFLKVQLSTLAAQMRQEEHQAEIDAKRSEVEEQLADVLNGDESQPEISAKETSANNENVEEIIASHVTPCIRCGGEIKSGEACKWIPSEGVFHAHC